MIFFLVGCANNDSSEDTEVSIVTSSTEVTEIVEDTVSPNFVKNPNVDEITEYSANISWIVEDDYGPPNISITLNDELLKLVRGNLDDENLSPRVTISRIRQAIKDKLRQSMITTAEMNGKNAIVNQTKIDELINKSFKKRLHHQFWQQLKTIHDITNKK